MKTCQNCGEEIFTKDGENLCVSCDAAEGNRKALANARRRTNRKARESMLRDLGLKKVRGALGGVYWE